jgi:uncharacterized membrane protein YhaH (DUF805 family)
MNWYVEVLKKYAVFSGRARRKEYWMFFLFNIVIGGILALIEGLTGIAPNSDQSVLATIYMFAVLIPGIAVGVRRLHDTGRSGWWTLIALIPILGSLVLLFWMVLDSEPGQNQYGPNPKLAEAV